MSTLQNQITNLISALDNSGLHSAGINLFSLDGAPAQELHNSYALTSTNGDITEGQTHGGITYDNVEIAARVVRSWAGSENTSVTYNEAFLDMTELFEVIEKNTFGTGIGIGYFTIDNFNDTNDWLELNIQFFLNAFSTRT